MTKHSEVVPNLGNQKAACAWLDLRRRQVFNLVQDGVITVDERTGLFNRDVVTVQYIQFLRKARNGQLNKLPGPLEDAKERLTRAQAELAEMEVREKMGELVRLPAVAIYWQAMVIAMRSKLLAVPTKAAAMIATPEKLQEVTDIITRFVHEGLAEIAGDGVSEEIRARVSEVIKPSERADRDSRPPRSRARKGTRP